jgi:hypothetical protein
MEPYGYQVALHHAMGSLHKLIREILPMLTLLLCASLLTAQAPSPGTGPGKGEKPKNPPPYANEPETGIAKPPIGTTPHDAADKDQKSTDSKSKNKAKKGKTKKTQQPEKKSI